jgi:hypothetical protein
MEAVRKGLTEKWVFEYKPEEVREQLQPIWGNMSEVGGTGNEIVLRPEEWEGWQ